MMQQRSDAIGINGFVLGLLTGAAVGAALAIIYAPRISAAAVTTYRDASTRMADAVDDVTARGQAVRDDVADAVGRGAREVERFAMASKTIPDTRRS